MRRGAERSCARPTALDASVKPPRSGSLSRGTLVDTAHDRRRFPIRGTNDPALSVQQIEQPAPRSSGLQDPRALSGVPLCVHASRSSRKGSHDFTGDEPLRSPHAAGISSPRETLRCLVNICANESLSACNWLTGATNEDT